MRALLICPAARPAVALLAENAPLALLPVLGKSVVEYWIEHLRTLGAREVFVLADDRPEQIRSFLGNGARWGVQVEVLPEIRELAPQEARAKYLTREDSGWLAAPHDASLMDRLPQLAHGPLFDSYSGWFSVAQAWFPLAVTPDRIGVRELSPGVWAGLRAKVSPQAKLIAPCWLGEDVSVEAGAVVGPMAVVEDRALIAAGSEVSNSIVGPETYIGEWTEVKDSLAWGSTLIRWQEGACARVPDPFLLCSLTSRRPRHRLVSVTGRLAAAFIMLLGLPFAALVALKALWDRRPVLSACVAVKPQMNGEFPPVETLIYHELGCSHPWLRRWPQLWKVVQGEFAWVGNRPLDPVQALELNTEFDRLWLAAPIGLISLADAEACADMLGDEARAHATYYAARARWQLDLSILARVFMRQPPSQFAWLPSVSTILPRVDTKPSLEESKSS
jgi:hypothetical protein